MQYFHINNKNQVFIKGLTVLKGLTAFILAGCILVLGACGRPDLIVTTDDSADYKSARTLPPLKKTRTVQNTDSSPSPIVETSVETPVYTPAETPIETPVETPQAQIEPSPTDTASAVESTPSVVANIIQPKSGVSRLQLDLGFNEAWNFLVDGVLKSNVTLHSRNKAAGILSIGCGEIGESEPVSNEGGWSIFRKKNQLSEYCSMQLIGDDDQSRVLVLNQSGDEVSSVQSEAIFNQLIQN